LRCVLCLGDGEVPWQQFHDPADGLVGDPFEDLVQVQFGVKPVELG
jgi:hypothetical protein